MGGENAFSSADSIENSTADVRTLTLAVQNGHRDQLEQLHLGPLSGRWVRFSHIEGEGFQAKPFQCQQSHYDSQRNQQLRLRGVHDTNVSAE